MHFLSTLDHVFIYIKFVRKETANSIFIIKILQNQPHTPVCLCSMCIAMSGIGITPGDPNSRNRTESWIWFQFQQNWSKSKLKLLNLFSCNQNWNNLMWIQQNVNCFERNQNHSCIAWKSNQNGSLESNLFFNPQPLLYFTTAKIYWKL